MNWCHPIDFTIERKRQRNKSVNKDFDINCTLLFDFQKKSKTHIHSQQMIQSINVDNLNNNCLCINVIFYDPQTFTSSFHSKTYNKKKSDMCINFHTNLTKWQWQLIKKREIKLKNMENLLGFHSILTLFYFLPNIEVI